MEIMEAIHRGEIKALLSICFNPLVSLPDANFTREALEKLEFFGVIDFFLSETAQHADVVLAGSLQEEEEGVACSAEGRVIHIQKAVDPPGERAAGLADLSAISRAALGQGEVLPVSRTPREIFDELREASRGGPCGLLRHHLREDRRADGRVLALPDAGSSRERRGCSKAAGSFIPTARRGFSHASIASRGDPVDAEYPDLSDDRPRGQPVPVRHADAPHRRAGRSVPRTARGNPSAAGGGALASQTTTG